MGKSEWWEPAADFCARNNVSPSLLIYICYKFINIRPEFPAYPFGAGLFRSEQAMTRAVDNFRWSLEYDLRQAEKLHQLLYDKAMFIPDSASQAAHLAARMTSAFIGKVMEIRVAIMMKTTGKAVEPWLHDLLLYKLCDGNPFVAVNHAKTETLRVLSAVNAFVYAHNQPWAAQAWEGNMVMGSLTDANSMAGTRCADYYREGRLGWHTPVAIPKPPFDPHPGALPEKLSLCLLAPSLCEKTEMLINYEIELKRKAASGGGSAWR
jgi:hypothetical protein